MQSSTLARLQCVLSAGAHEERSQARELESVATMTLGRLALATLAALLVACAGETGGPHTSADEQVAAQPWRDWRAHPAVVEIDDADEIFALSDPHGGYPQLAQLLTANGLIASFPASPDDAAKVRWTGGNAILVVAGDLIDKGPSSLGVIDLLRSLESQAPASGGRVVVTLGNHEAEFFVDPHNDKATSNAPDAVGIDNELRVRGIDPADIAARRDVDGRGAWMANLPFAVRVKKWFFAHSGNTEGDSIPALEQRLRRALDTKGWRAKDITGKDSILEAEEWYGRPDKDDTARRNAAALGVKHIVFGHDPGAMKDRGRILASGDAALVKLNVNMGLDLKQSTKGGLLLHVHTKGTDSFEVLDSQGRAAPVPATR